MEANAQELRLHDAWSHRLGYAAALGVIAISAAICNGARPTQGTTELVWPTKEWQRSSPEEEGMDSKQLANVVDFGTTHGFESRQACLHGGWPLWPGDYDLSRSGRCGGDDGPQGIPIE